MTYTCELGANEFLRGIKHGMELWWDGSTPTHRLDQRGGRSGFTRFVNARVEGKFGEEAFRQFLQNEYGIMSSVDYRIYGDYTETDHGDLQYLVGDDGGQFAPATEFDIKKSKPWNSWLLIRDSIFTQHPDDAPFILTTLSLEDDMIVDEWEDTGSWSDVANSQSFDQQFNQYVSEQLPITVELVGSAYPDEFTDYFEKGETLYDPDTGRTLGSGLRRDNQGIHVDDLVATDDRWNRIVDEITGDNPISYDHI